MIKFNNTSKNHNANFNKSKKNLPKSRFVIHNLDLRKIDRVLFGGTVVYTTDGRKLGFYGDKLNDIKEAIAKYEKEKEIEKEKEKEREKQREKKREIEKERQRKREIEKEKERERERQREKERQRERERERKRKEERKFIEKGMQKGPIDAKKWLSKFPKAKLSSKDNANSFVNKQKSVFNLKNKLVKSVFVEDSFKPKKIQLGILKSVLKSDFFLVKKNLKNIYRFKPSLIVTNQNYFFLDLFKLSKEIRQLYLMLRHFVFNYRGLYKKKFYHKRGIKRYKKLLMLVQDKTQSDMAYDYCKTYKISLRPKIRHEVQSILTRTNKEKIVRYLISAHNLSSGHLEKKVRDQKIYIVNNINMRSSVTNSHYRIFNNLDNMKKLYFILSIVEKISKLN